MNKQQLIQIATRNVLEKRNNAIDRCEKLLAKLRAIPQWAECEKNLKQAQVDFVMLGNRDCDKQKIAHYQALQQKMLEKCHLTAQDLKPKFSCQLCQDTGYVGNVACQCLQAEIRKQLVKNSNVANPNHTFENSCEKDKHNNLVYKKAQKICQEGDYRNLLLVGNTGTGKTYLLCACANECLATNKSVLYTTAYALNETFLECHLSGYETKQIVMENLLDVDALFVDDLGTENIYRNVTAEYLFVIINERIVRGKQTFISTNLSLADIRERYDERIFSRLVDKNITFVAQLTGNDKRM